MRTFFSGFMLVFMLITIAKGQSVLDLKIQKAIATVVSEEPTERDPVSLGAALVAVGDSLAVIVKVRMAPAWHIYQYVPANSPYVQLENILTLPKGLVKVGKWQSNPPMAYVEDPNVLIHEEHAWFVHKIVGRVDKGGLIGTGLYYQTCDHKQCLPPMEVKIELKIQ